MHSKLFSLNTLAAACALAVSATSVQANEASYEVTITNMTRAQTFTPILVASHRGGVKLFDAGSPASAELAALAEGGDVDPLTAVLNANPAVIDVQNSGDLLVPGASVTVTVAAESARAISLASMMIPTNDGFISLNDMPAPRGNKTRRYVSPAYDAGSEPNDENCMHIPGPVCGGEGGSPGAGGEGYVHIHTGMHGIGDLDAATYDWRNPTAEITIRRIGR